MSMKRRHGLFVLSGVVVALVLAVVFSPWASSAPDGLEKIARKLGLIDSNSASPVWRSSPASDYQVPGVGNERSATRLAGLLGTAVAFAGGALLGRVLIRQRRGGSQSAPRRADGGVTRPDPQS